MTPLDPNGPKVVNGEPLDQSKPLGPIRDCTCWAGVEDSLVKYIRQNP